MASRRGISLAPGIWRGPTHCTVIVTVARQNHERHYPPTLPLEELRIKQSEERLYWQRCATDDAARVGPVAPRGTFAGDAAAYLRSRDGRPSHKADRSHLAAWSQAHGSKPRHLLTAHVAATQISAWLAAGKSPKTIKHRVRVAKELWHYCDGPGRRTPFDGLTLPRVPKTIPVPVDESIIVAVAASLKAGLTIQKRCGPKRTLTTVHCPEADVTYARFLIRALTGQRPSQIGHATPGDIDRANKVWWVRAGKGGHPVPFPLTDEIDVAWQYFDRVQAWGRFDCRSFSKTLKRHGWPQDTRPYALRHTFAIRQLLAGVDLGDLQGLLGHTSPTTTRVYAPVLVSRLRAALTRQPLKLVKHG